MIARDLPSDVESERLLLAGVFDDPSDEGAFFSAVADIGEAAFYDRRHRAIWAAVQKVTRQGGRPAYSSVLQALEQQCLLDDVGGKEFVYGLVDGVPRNLRAEPLASALKEKQALRACLRRLHEAESRIYQGDTLAAVQEHLLAAAITSSGPQGVRDPAEVASEALKELEAEISGTLVGIPSGLRGLDECLRGGGFMRGQLVYVGARPSRGKTSLLSQCAVSAAGQNKRVLFFSLEMPDREVAKRLLLAEARVKIEHARRGTAAVKEKAFSDLAKAFGRCVTEKPVRIASNASRTAAAIRAECFRERASHGLDMVVVDYLGYMESADQKSSLYERTSANSKALHSLACDLDVPVLAGVQLNRVSESTTSKRPTLANFRDSGSIEQDADIAILIHQEGAENAIQTGAAELFVAKQRNGWTGRVDVLFDGESARFRDQDQ